MVTRKKNSFRLTHRITDRASCESAIRSSVLFWAIPAVIGPIGAALNILQAGPAPVRGAAALLDLWPLAFFGLIAVLALRVHQHKSRVASTLLFAIFIGSVLISYVMYGFTAASGLNLGFQIYLGFIYFLGMRGTYLWHSTYRDAPQTPETVGTEGEDGGNWLEQDGQELLPQSRTDMCPKCFEYFEDDELTCRYCGTHLLSGSSLAHA